jgi:DNA ligase D-like protein (predicted polymerase)
MQVSTEEGWKKLSEKVVLTRTSESFEGKEIIITDANATIWRGITKRDVMRYYEQIAPYILKYLRNRPLGLYSMIYGLEKEGLYIGGMPDNYPEWLQVFRTERKNPKPGKKPYVESLVCNDIPTMMFMVNNWCVDFHASNARTDDPANPDYIVIDLDPTVPDFSKATDVALAAKEVLDKHELLSFIKTSGQTGYHIFVPCTGIEWEKGDARKVGLALAEEIHSLVPDITTLAPQKKNRGENVYVDPSQNDFLDTMAVAYCVRPAETPNVSTPLEWTEISPGLNPADFNIESIFKRLEKKGDLWEGLDDRNIKEKNTRLLRKLL